MYSLQYITLLAGNSLHGASIIQYHSGYDIKWSDSRKVDCVDVFMYDIILIAGIANHSKPQWLILNGQTVGELTV